MPTKSAIATPKNHINKHGQVFHACATLCVLLAATYGQCSACESSISYFAKNDGVVRKRRPPKPQEIQRRPKQIKFSLQSAHGRTAKHKKHFNVDSGATISCTNDSTIFETIDDIKPSLQVKVANGQVVRPTLCGTVRLNLRDKENKNHSILLRNVFYSPDFSANLLSVDEIYNQHNYVTTFRGRRAHFTTPDGDHIPIVRDEKSRYMLQAYSLVTESATLWHKRLMHAGNQSLHRVAHHIPTLISEKIDFSKCDSCLQGGATKQPFGKRHWSKRQPPDSAYRKTPVINRFTYFGERIACDLCGPFPTGYNGDKYAIVFHDSHTLHIAVHTLPDKSKETVLASFQLFIQDHQSLLSKGIKEFWADNGGEFHNSDMDQFCEELCIKRSFSVPYCPPQNAYAERAWYSVLRPMRCAFVDSGVPHKFWPYFIKQAALVHNVLHDGYGSSPHYRAYNTSFDYNKLRAMGCLCYYLLPERERLSKLSPRAVPAYYLGLDNERHGHLVYVPSLSRITTAHHVVFNEDRKYDPSLDPNYVKIRDDPSTPGDIEPIGNTRRTYGEDRDNDVVPHTRAADDPLHSTDSDWNPDHCPNSKCTFPRGHEGQCSDDPSRFSRFRVLPHRRYAESLLHSIYPVCSDSRCVFSNDHCGPCEDNFATIIHNQKRETKYNHTIFTDDLNRSCYRVFLDDVSHEALQVDANLFSDVPCPKTYEDVQSSPLKPRWIQSMLDEITALKRNDTWTYISRNDPRLRRRKPTKSRWVYTIKYNKDGTISKLKSRFVVCGYSQREGIDYDRTFSATLRASSFRTLLAIAAGKKLRLMQIDISNAFTQAEMDDADVFVEPPKGFEEYEFVDGKQVSKLLYLQRALYGTKQASRLWQEALRNFLTKECSLRFVASFADPCLFRVVSSDGKCEIILGVYVDDIVIAYTSGPDGDKLYSTFMSQLRARFECTDAHKLEWFLGMAIDQHEDYSIHVSHEQSIQKLADKFIPHNQITRDCPPTELFSKLDRAQDDEERAKAREYEYSSLVGALLYIGVTSRPDIAFHTSVLAKFLADPSMDCCKAATQLLQYLHANKKKRMYYSGKCVVPGGCEMHRVDIERNHGFIAYSDSSWGNQYPYPMFGYGIYLYGGLISYGSKQLKTVAFSSCEAEYAAASYACKEIEFIRNICTDMGVVLDSRLVLALDNTACIDIANDVGVSARTKHFDRSIHYLRDLTQMRRILPFYVKTDQQLADGYTKSLDKSKFHSWVMHVLRD